MSELNIRIPGKEKEKIEMIKKYFGVSVELGYSGVIILTGKPEALKAIEEISTIMIVNETVSNESKDKIGAHI